MQFENFHALVDEHRRKWPVERIVTDLDSFRADCARVLSHVPGFEAGAIADVLSPFWLDLMFGEDPASPGPGPSRP